MSTIVIFVVIAVAGGLMYVKSRGHGLTESDRAWRASQRRGRYSSSNSWSGGMMGGYAGGTDSSGYCGGGGYDGGGFGGGGDGGGGC